MILFIILIPRSLQVNDPTFWPQSVHSLYQSLGKLLFVMGLSLTILPSLLGSLKSIIYFTMDTKLFNFIGKISFCTYLIHLIVLIVWVQSRTYDRYYTIVPVLAEFGGVLVLALFFGLVMTILVEMPFSKLQKKLVNFIKVFMGLNNIVRK